MSLDRRQEGVTITPNVQADYGQLDTVVVHSPGDEMRFPPDQKEELLVDSTVDLQLIQDHHGTFAASLEEAGAKVYRIEDLVADQCEDRANRLELAQRLQSDPLLAGDRGNGYPGLTDQDVYRLAGDDYNSDQFVEAFISGRWPGTDISFMRSDPNVLFPRDMMAVVGQFVVLASFSKSARKREQLLVEMMLRHPLFDQLNIINFPNIEGATFEGGDIMMVNSHLALVGISERTNPMAVNSLTWVLRDSGIAVAAVNFKNHKRREWMHLDTVLSFVSPERYLAYPRMFDPTVPEEERIEVELIRSRDGVLDWDHPEPDLSKVLSDYGYTGRPVFVGGPSRIDQDREQYSGATNVITVRPDAFVMYARNHQTAETLRAEGFEIAYDIGDFSDYLADGRPVALLIDDSETFRLCGGPHCMTLPLVRRL